MSDGGGSARGLILIILDTLRTDFYELAGAELPNFRRLERLCSVFPRARCGSFPTGPMRTDLLTGRLSFLDDRWAVPERGEITLTRALRDRGVRTALVTDNYVAACPQIGGMLLPEFDTFDFIRGAGSDPWQTPTAALRGLRQTAADRPPSRSVDFEIQYLANASAWAEAGGTPTERLFRAAAQQIRILEDYDRFLLWIDSFACHEPWDPAGLDFTSLPRLPLFPGYVEKERFAEADLGEFRRQYAESIRHLDRELGRIVDDVERLAGAGEIALAVLSDHGFLFGEYGFVGKPPNTPLPPQLHDLVCWLSPHFEPLLPSNERAIQPHTLHAMIHRLFGTGRTTTANAELHVFGRNSPRSDYIAAAADGELYVGAKEGNGTAEFSMIPAAGLRADLPLMKHERRELPDDVAAQLGRILDHGKSDWLTPFREALAKPYANAPSRATDKPPRTVDALVVCALDIEFDALRKTIGGTSPRAVHDGISFWHFFARVGEMDVVVVQLAAPWAGNVSSCGVTASLLPLLDPWLVVSFGIAGTLDETQIPSCDVVFARSISYIDLRKETEDPGQWTMKQIPQMMTRPELLNLLLSLRSPRIHKVDIVSSEAVVKSVKAARREVAAHAVADAKVVEMEAFGVYKACELDEQYVTGTTRYCVAIKGISDNASLQKDDSLHREAATRAAEFLRDVLNDARMKDLRKRSEIDMRPLPLRPFTMENGADRAARDFMEVARPAVRGRIRATDFLQAIHMRHPRPRVFYHWRLKAKGLHWVDFYFLRVFSALAKLGYPIECLVTDRAPEKSEATVNEWREAAVQLVDGILGDAEHRVTFYQDVARQEGELAEFALSSGSGQTMLESLANAKQPPGQPLRPHANQNMQLNMWLRYIAWRSRVDGTCIVFHRPLSSVYRLLWHFRDLVPCVLPTRGMNLAKKFGKFVEPGASLYLMPPAHPSIMDWLRNPTELGEASLDDTLIELWQYLSGREWPGDDEARAARRERPAGIYLDPLGIPPEWLVAFEGGGPRSDFLKAAVAVELARLTEQYWPEFAARGD